MANEKNLVPFTSEQSREEAAKNGQKGGIKSAKADADEIILVNKVFKNVAKPSSFDIIKSKEMLRKTGNTGAFKHLPERMSKKHIRELAKEYDISLDGMKLNIDFNEELLRFPLAGRADAEEIGGITFFPNSFRSKEELLRTLFHEKQHVEQFKEFGTEYVQENRVYFEQITETLEEEFISRLKKEGKL